MAREEVDSLVFIFGSIYGYIGPTLIDIYQNKLLLPIKIFNVPVKAYTQRLVLRDAGVGFHIPFPELRRIHIMAAIGKELRNEVQRKAVNG